jgi:lysophospholipase L1-like esterase
MRGPRHAASLTPTRVRLPSTTMSESDRSWTIAPTLACFAGFAIVGISLVDGDITALADRLTTPREADAPITAGPVFTAKPIEVAEADPDDKPPPTAAADKGDRARVGALEDVCLEGTTTACKRWGMDGLYRAITEGRKAKLGRPVRVSWYGDSVIATDAIPGRLRTRLQGNLGDGGPGFVYVVAPHRFCAHEGVERTAGGGWMTYGISTAPIGDKLYGVGGSTAETTGGRATLKLLAGTATSVELYYLSQPRGGTATITSDAGPVLVADTKADAKQAGYATGTTTGAKKLTVETTGRVRVFGVAIENATGAVVDNLGIVSVNVKSFVNHDPAHFVGELAHRHADLVMIMIGANEAAWLSPGDRDTKDYQTRYETVLATLRKGRPDGACLVVSPTDQAEAKDGAYPSRPVMPVLVEAQRKAAHAQGCAFYSTYDWMGGKGSAAQWFRKGLVGSDFQHLSRKGANKMADGIYDALIAGFARYAGN